MSREPGLPITIVTGFLGAGKTTLIFGLVTARQRERIGVIVGDVADTPIDGELLSAVVEAVDAVAPSTGDCTHFAPAIEHMHRLIPGLDRIVVETSGLDDPAPLLDAINHDLGFAHVDAVIALVDPAEPAGAQHSPVRRQLQLATHIIISKADLVSTAALSHVRARVRALNPRAQLLSGSGHILDCGPLLDSLAGPGARRDALSCPGVPIRRRATRAGTRRPAPSKATLIEVLTPQGGRQGASLAAIPQDHLANENHSLLGCLAMIPRWFIAALAVTLVAAFLAACGSGDGDAQDDSDARPAVVATTTQVADLARQVTGDRAHVRQILKANTDAHDYEPRPSDVEAISEADVVLRSGGDLDEWLDGVLQDAGTDAKVLILIDSVRTREGEGETDPHWWQDPRNAIIAIGQIRDALSAADPGGRGAYTSNADAYLTRLRTLDQAIETCVDKVPAARRKLVTDHDALGYFADRYEIEIIGTVIPALSTRAQASAGETARLVRTIRAAGVTTIFPQSSASAKLTRAIARDAGAKVGPALYADSLGPEGSAGATYIGSMQHNTRALVNGFTDGRASCEL